MTRKRFCKLLMSYKFTRNEANEIARNVFANGLHIKSYNRYFKCMYAFILNKSYYIISNKHTNKNKEV